MIDVRIYEIIWKEQFVEKIIRKHGVTPSEVEQALLSKPYIRKAEKGQVKGEDVYVAYGQTRSGRYLLVFFINKRRGAVMPISARDMNSKQRRVYHAQKKAR
uniref:Hypothetical conserved protein n=1 Tax=Acetithermum autotrophicum TaxID=1446466 RepID=H5SQK3_ACEAU|nr:hypothetical conserved protein [Candidatus Acetothermum autotrophicum]